MAFRASPVAIVITDLRDGRFLEVNDQFLRLFGFDRGDVLGHTSVDLGMWADIERRQNVRVDRCGCVCCDGSSRNRLQLPCQ